MLYLRILASSRIPDDGPYRLTPRFRGGDVTVAHCLKNNWCILLLLDAFDLDRPILYTYDESKVFSRTRSTYGTSCQCMEHVQYMPQ